MTRARLDQVLVARGGFPSRARARDAILRGCVRVDGTVTSKPGQLVGDGAELTLDDPAQGYVARSALKLIGALDHYSIPIEGRHVLDVGQSTGGFTQVLLERGAAHVTGVDVGFGQLAEGLRDDPRVTALEGVNARDPAALPPGPFDLAVVDVSFISLALVLPAVLSRIAVGGFIIALFKPQFEVGREHIGKGGLVSDEAAVDSAQARLAALLPTLGWKLHASMTSPLAGGDGNRERLLLLVGAHAVPHI